MSEIKRFKVGDILTAQRMNEIIDAIEPQKKDSGNIPYYDFAIWQRKFAGWGSNAIAFFGYDQKEIIKRGTFIGSQRKFLVQVGRFSRGEEKQYYTGRIYKESILQGLEERPDRYKVFLYIPVLCNKMRVGRYEYQYNNTKGETIYKNIIGWEAYKKNVENGDIEGLKYSIDGGKWEDFIFTYRKNVRVFCFYKTKKEWLDTFSDEGKEYIDITIWDPSGHKHDGNKYQNHSMVMFAGFRSNSNFGIFKTLEDTFDLRFKVRIKHEEDPYKFPPDYRKGTLIDKYHLYRLYSSPQEHVWHMEKIKEDHVRCKRHMLDIVLNHEEHLLRNTITRSSYRIFGDNQLWRKLVVPYTVRYHESQELWQNNNRITKKGERLYRWNDVNSNTQNVNDLNVVDRELQGTTQDQVLRSILYSYNPRRPNCLIYRGIRPKRNALRRRLVLNDYPYVGSKEFKGNGRGAVNAPIVIGETRAIDRNRIGYKKPYKMVYSYRPIMSWNMLCDDNSMQNFIKHKLFFSDPKKAQHDLGLGQRFHRSGLSIPVYIKIVVGDFVVNDTIRTKTRSGYRDSRKGITYKQRCVSFRKIWYASKLYEYVLYCEYPNDIKPINENIWWKESTDREVKAKFVRVIDPRDIKEQF